MKALLSSVTGQWIEVSEDIAKASDPDRISEIVETVAPLVDETNEVTSSIIDVDGKPTRIYKVRQLTKDEQRTYSTGIEFLDRLGDQVLVGLCEAALKDPVMLANLLRLCAALYIESDDVRLQVAIDVAISAGLPIDKKALFGGWRKRPPIDSIGQSSETRG